MSVTTPNHGVIQIPPYFQLAIEINHSKVWTKMERANRNRTEVQLSNVCDCKKEPNACTCKEECTAGKNKEDFTVQLWGREGKSKRVNFFIYPTI